MNGLLNTLAANWHKANLRTRYALVVLFAIVLWLGVERQQQAAGAAIARNVQAQENLARVSGGDIGEEWLDRAARTQADLASWRARLWSGSTPGVVAAEVQRRIVTIAGENGISPATVEVDPVPIEIGGMNALRFTISGRSRDQFEILQALAALAENERMLIIDEADIRITVQETGIVTMAGLAPFVTIAAPTAPDGES